MPRCGDGIIDAPETCDVGNDQACPGRCIAAGNTGACTCSLCGNGIVDANETCDDGNSIEGCRPDKPQKPLDPCRNNCTKQICKDPSRIYYSGGRLARILVHGRMDLTAADLTKLTQSGLQLRLSSPAAPGGIVFQTNLALIGMPVGSVRSSDGRYRYSNPEARVSGGMATVLIRKRGASSYAFTIEAYGNLSAATSPMTTHVTLGGQEWTVTAPWFETSNGWRSAH
jgi:hypothetical protein